MRAKITAKADNPMDQQFSMTITMSLDDWKNLANRLLELKHNNMNEWALIDAARKIVITAETTFKEEITN